MKPLPTDLTPKEFTYWHQAQEAKQAATEAHYMSFCIGLFCLGLGIFIGQLF